jgi:co-chaperonin GroES (HSP10)
MDWMDIMFVCQAIFIVIWVGTVIWLGVNWLVRKLARSRSSINYEPFDDRLLIRRLERKVQPIPDGVVMPQSQQAPLNEGIVIAVGPDVPQAKWPGAHVCFVEHAGYEVEIDSESYLQMRDEEVIGRRVVPSKKREI